MGGPNFVCGSYQFTQRAMDMWKDIAAIFSVHEKYGEPKLTKTKDHEERIETNEAGLIHRQRLYADGFWSRPFEETYSQWVNIGGTDYRVTLWMEGNVMRQTEPPARVTGRVVKDTEDYTLEEDLPIEAMCKGISLVLFDVGGKPVFDVAYDNNKIRGNFGLGQEGFVYDPDKYQSCENLVNAVDASLFDNIQPVCIPYLG